jgi:hypothetical protein
VRHELPESRPGPSLGEAAAREIAVRGLKDLYGLASAQLKEVSSNQSQLPARRDWLFVWRDPSVRLKQGEARIAVRVAGDELAGYRRYVHVPEDWLRVERARRATMSVAKMLAGAALAVVLLWVGLVAFRDWVRGHFSTGAFALALAAGLGIELVQGFNEFVVSESAFVTSQPWTSQVLRYVLSAALAGLASTAVLAVLLGRAVRLPAHPERASRLAATGFAAGLALAGLASLAAWFGRAEHPAWPQYGAAGAWVPWLEALRVVSLYASGVVFLQLLYPWLARQFASRGARCAAIAALGLASGALMAESTLLEALGSGLASAVLLGLVGEVVRRTSPRVLIPLVAVPVALRSAKAISLRAYPGAVGANAVAIALVLAISWAWLRALEARDRS